MTDFISTGSTTTPPVVDDLRTRLLEKGCVTKGFVRRGQLRASGDGWIEVATEGLQRRGRRPCPEHAWLGDPPSPDATVPGTLRVEIVGNGTARIRFAEAAEVPANHTPMLVAEPAPTPGTTVEVFDDRVTLEADDISVEVTLDPVQVIVRDGAGVAVCHAGGPEKNRYRTWNSYNTGVARTPSGEPLATENFTLRPAESVFGFGEQFLALNKVGQTLDLTMEEAVGTTTPRSYKNVPFFMTTGGYGVFFNTSARMTAWVGSLSATDIQVAVEDDLLDWFVIVGSMRQILPRYTALTGRGSLPPRWSFGYWQSKISYSSASETLDVVRRMREHRFPMDVLHVDTNWFREDWRCDLEFDPDRFPDPKAWLDELAELGVKVSLWQLPYIPEGSPLFDELLEVDGFVRTLDGEFYDVGVSPTPDFDGRVGCIDLTNPAAVEIWTGYLRRLLELGVRAIKADFGEQAPLDALYADGTPGTHAHNLYPLLYNRAVAELTESVTGDSLIWARSAWAGSQRYPVHWGGDSTPNWENLAPQLRGGLSLGLSGFQFWSQDIGGFLGETGGRLLIRWFQASMFLSHCRIHGVGRRELYEFDEEVQRIGRKFLELRYRLLPYIYGSAARCVTDSLPMARSLALDFQGDPTTHHVEDQWLFGDSLLVAPVLDASKSRRVYFPEGTWTDWWTGEPHPGAAWNRDVDVPLDRLPLYVREGGIVATGPLVQHVGEYPVDAITLRISRFTGDGESTATVGVDDELVEVRYRAAGGRHEVQVHGHDEGTPPIAWTAQLLDGTPVEVVRSAGTEGEA